MVGSLIVCLVLVLFLIVSVIVRSDRWKIAGIVFALVAAGIVFVHFLMEGSKLPLAVYVLAWAAVIFYGTGMVRSAR